MSIQSKRYRRKPDLFSMLLLVVTLGVSVTVAYQVSLYHGASKPPIARQTPSFGIFGG